MRKNIIAGLILAGFGLFLNTDLLAQTPWLSKDVQKVANKKQLAKEEQSNSHIQAVSLDQSWVISKGVATVGTTETSSVGNIQSTGTPQVAISKGVHQKNTKKPVVEEKDDFQMRPAITGQE